MMPSPFYNVARIASIYRVSVRTVERWLSRDRLPRRKVRLPGQRRFRLRISIFECESWLARRPWILESSRKIQAAIARRRVA